MNVNRMAEELIARSNIVGRLEEIKSIIIAKLAKKPVLIEGPVGVGKTTLARAVASFFNQKFIRIDGDERFDEYKLVGYFEPQLVLKEGWNWKSFVPGPLTRAMLEGGILLINELNRLSEGAQNVLIPALDERVIEIPKLGEIKAKDGFWVIATLNPEEYVGVSPLSEALRDRFIWIKLEYQSREEEIEIVRRHTDAPEEIIAFSVSIVRATRRHPLIKRGASVRGAIDLARILSLLGNISYDELIKFVVNALGTKIEIAEESDRSLEDILGEIVEDIVEDSSFFRSRIQQKIK
ncbi:MAG: AAA family ATPase [Candidatus Njordarchaeales archaeon]